MLPILLTLGMNMLYRTICFICVSVLLSHSLVAQDQKVFYPLTVEDGMPHSEVNAITSDRDGFIWFGTYNGIARYDGYSLASITKDEDKSLRVISLYCDRDKELLFIGTEGNGLKIMDLNVGRITERMYPANTIYCIKADDNGDVWLGTERGLVCLKNSDGEWGYRFYGSDLGQVLDFAFPNERTAIVASSTGAKVFNLNSDSSVSILNGYERSIISMDDGGYLIGGSTGLFTYYPKTSEIACVEKADILSLFRFDENDYWVGTIDRGIMRFDDDLNVVEAYQIEANGRGLQNNTIKSFYRDFSDNLWIGTQNGAAKYSTRAESFEFYGDIMDIDEAGHVKTGNRTATFFEDHRGVIWVGMHHYGLKLFNHSTKSIKQYPAECWPEIEGQTISSYLEEEDGGMWVGTWRSLYKLSPSEAERVVKGQRTNAYDFGKANKLEETTFFKLQKDRYGTIWMSTTKGLMRFIPSSPGSQTGQIIRYLPSEVTTDFHIDYPNDNEIIVFCGTQHGLYKLVFSDGKDPLVIPVRDVIHGGTLLGEFISVVYCDSRDRLWVLGLDGYINKLETGRQDDSEPTFSSLDINTDETSYTSESLEEDNDGLFWIGGVTMLRFNPDDWSIDAFGESSGLQNRSFKIWSSTRLSSNELIFGGVNGFSVFNPQQLAHSNIPPVVALEDLYIQGRKVNVGESYSNREILSKTLNHTERIVLPHKYNSISISFVTLDYTSPANNRVEYQLAGYDKSWHSAIGAKHTAVYTNLPSGNYVFHVKGSNSDSVWSSTAKDLTVRVLRPIAWSIPMILLYLAVLGLGIYLLMRYYKNKRRVEKDAKMNELKLKYFTDISHEIKTPLSLISAPVAELADNPETDAFTRRRLQLVRKNIGRLTDLIEQIMDFNRFESNTMSLRLSEEDLVNVCRTTMSYFEDKAEAKDIDFGFQTDVPQIPVVIDRDRIEKLLFNIIGNAFKFTPNGGSISVRCHTRNEDTLVCVSDSGVGIEQADLPHIFERFYYDSSSENGSGIGLALAKAIVEQHRGKIWAESEPGKGTSIFFTLKFGSSHFNAEELKHFSPDRRNDIRSFTVLRDNELADDDLYGENEGADTMYRVLLAEDNRDMREYLKESLDQHFNVTACKDGGEAFNLAQQNDFDCIVSDVMMPGTDGIELCRKAKTDITLSHIPIILLTAKDNLESKLEGYGVGADDYITKPFEMKILISRIENLIAQRNALKVAFRKGLDIAPSEVTITPIDEQFMQRCLSLIEANIGEPSYNVERLCDDLSMSRPTVYKKIKSLTGLSVVAFIRSIRIKRAAQLLLQDGSSIKNIMYMVGFDNSSYFSARFKKEFGCTPAEYVEKNKA